MTDDYPITPGSPVDIALDSCVRHIVRDAPFDIEAFKTLSMCNPAQMLALGTRVWLLNAGVSEPRNLVSTVHAQWYGQAPGGTCGRKNESA